MLVRERLIKARENKGYTQKNIADLLGVRTDFYNRVENGKKACPLNLAVELAEILGVTVDYLLGRGD